MKTQAYCVKCKSKKAIADGVESVLKNGRKAIKGKCPTCGTGMFKILGASKGSSKPARKDAPNAVIELPKGKSYRFTFFHE
jgi:hypothetical protein